MVARRRVCGKEGLRQKKSGFMAVEKPSYDSLIVAMGKEVCGGRKVGFSGENAGF